jgi:hypothetical protein
VRRDVHKVEVAARRQDLFHLVHDHDHVAQVNLFAHLGHPPAVNNGAAVAAAGDDDAQFADHRLASFSAR